MGKFTQPHRTVRDIKTLAGKSDDLLTPHKMYMRLFALETERHRRQQERASAMLRVTNIDIRCAEIDQEKQELLRLLGVENIATVPIDPQADTGMENSSLQVKPVRQSMMRHLHAARVEESPLPGVAEVSVYAPVKIRY